MPQEQNSTVETAKQARPAGRHAAKDGAEVDPLIDLSRDPHPGVADHAAPGEE